MIEFSIALSVLTLLITGFIVLLLLISYHNGMRAGLFKAARKGIISVGEINREIDVISTMNQYFSLRSLFRSGDYIFTYAAYSNVDDKIANTNGRAADLGNTAEIVTYSIHSNFQNTLNNVFLPKIQASEHITMFNENS